MTNSEIIVFSIHINAVKLNQIESNRFKLSGVVKKREEKIGVKRREGSKKKKREVMRKEGKRREQKD